MNSKRMIQGVARLVATFVATVTLAYAEKPKSPPKKIESSVSNCFVEHPADGKYRVFRKGDKNPVFVPGEEGISGGVFSHSGNLIAFGGSEVAPPDLGALVIFNCKTGQATGQDVEPAGAQNWINGASIQWASDDRSLMADVWVRHEGWKKVRYQVEK